MWVSSNSPYLEFCVFPEWLYSCISSNLGSLQSLFLQIVSRTLSLSVPSEILIMSTLLCSMVAYTSLRLCSLFSKLFPFCSSNSITFTVLTSKFFDCSLLKSAFEYSSEFFNFSYCTFHLQNFLLGFLSLYLYFHFVHILYSWLSPPFFCSLGIFMTVVLKSLSSISATCLFQKFLLKFFSWMGHSCLFLCTPCDCFLNTGVLNSESNNVVTLRIRFSP